YGLLEHGRGRHREALRLIRQAVEHAPGAAGLHSDLGNVLFELDRPDLAVQAYEEAIRLAPEGVAARNNLGVALRVLRLPEAAEGVYREAIA
ncbi:tetratricopeptide repeat protein, partial [Acinetobacter baumannii]